MIITLMIIIIVILYIDNDNDNDNEQEKATEIMKSPDVAGNADKHLSLAQTQAASIKTCVHTLCVYEYVRVYIYIYIYIHTYMFVFI